MKQRHLSNVCGEIDKENLTLNFKLFYEKKGIKRQFTTTYTPHKNVVAEFKNRIVMNMVYYMLYAKMLPKSFWDEVVNWTLYLLSQCPTLVVKNITPQEA